MCVVCAGDECKDVTEDHECCHDQTHHGQNLPSIFVLIGQAGVALMIFESGMHFDFGKVRQVRAAPTHTTQHRCCVLCFVFRVLCVRMCIFLSFYPFLSVCLSVCQVGGGALVVALIGTLLPIGLGMLFVYMYNTQTHNTTRLPVCSFARPCDVYLTLSMPSLLWCAGWRASTAMSSTAMKTRAASLQEWYSPPSHMDPHPHPHIPRRLLVLFVLCWLCWLA